MEAAEEVVMLLSSMITLNLLEYIQIVWRCPLGLFYESFSAFSNNSPESLDLLIDAAVLSLNGTL